MGVIVASISICLYTYNQTLSLDTLKLIFCRYGSHHESGGRLLIVVFMFSDVLPEFIFCNDGKRDVPLDKEREERRIQCVGEPWIEEIVRIRDECLQHCLGLPGSPEIHEELVGRDLFDDFHKNLETIQEKQIIR